MGSQAPSRAGLAKNRLEGLDLARYLAFIGMVFVNFDAAMTLGAPLNADVDAGLVHALIAALQGRAAATFVVLAGIGLGLASRKWGDRTTTIALRRAAFLLCLGLVNMMILDADILHFYAFYFLFGAFLLPLGNRALIAIMIGLNVVFLAMILTLDFEVGWDWTDHSYADFWTPVGFLRNVFFNGWHPVIPWLGFLLFGLIVSRAALTTRATQMRLALGGAAALVIAEIASGVLAARLGAITPEFAVFATTKPVPPLPLYTVAGLGAASMVIGLCLLAEPRLRRLGVLGLLTPAGRQILTLYVVHILVALGLFEILMIPARQTPEQAAVAAALFCIAATVFALVWSRRYGRGLLEGAMRRLAR